MDTELWVVLWDRSPQILGRDIIKITV